MRKEKYSPGSTYFRRILIMVLSAFLTITLIFSSVLYFYVNKISQENAYESSHELLLQMKNNIEFMDNLARNACMSLYLDEHVQDVMFGRNNNNDISKLVMNINQIRSLTSIANPYISSVVIYNHDDNRFYSTALLYPDEQSLRKLFTSNNGNVSKLTCIPRQDENVINGYSVTEDVLTYVMYTSVDANNQPEGAVIINIKSEWLLENIKKLNSEDYSSNDVIFLLDNSNNLIKYQHPDEKLVDSIKNDYLSLKAKGYASSYDLIYALINGKKYAINYMKLDDVNFTIINAKPYEELLKLYNTMRVVIIICLLLILAGLAFSILLSRRIYRPIGNLVNKLRQKNVTEMLEHNNKDELQVLRQIVDKIIEYDQKSKMDQEKYQVVLKRFYLREMIMGNDSIQEDGIKTAREVGLAALEDNRYKVICLLRIDDYNNFRINMEPKEQELLRFCVLNIFNELVSNEFGCDSIDLKNDKLVIIIVTDSASPAVYDRINALAREGQKCVMKYLGLSLSVSISSATTSYAKLAGQYNEALNNSMYRYIYGQLSVIDYLMVEENNSNQKFDYSFATEKKFISQIRTKEMNNANDTLLDLLNEMTFLSYNQIMIAIMHLLFSFKNVINEIDEKRFRSDFTGHSFSIDAVFDFETIDFLYNSIAKVMDSIVESCEREVDEKHNAINEAICVYINANISKRDLCLSQIASVLKMSPVYIGRMFRQEMDISIADYINDARLNAAMEYFISRPNSNVYQIMEMVGIDNSSHFYKIFKKKYGMAPKEYIIKNNLDHI